MAAVTNAAVIPRLLRQTVLHGIVRQDGKVLFTVACFGQEFDREQGINWSLSLLDDPNHRERMGKALRAMGAKRALAPSPVRFNAEFVDPDELTSVIPLGNGISIHRNAGRPADASYLRPGDAGIFSTGGCAMIVATNGKDVLFAHAGRDSLIDRERILRGKPRKYQSVCDTLVERLVTPDAPVTGVKVWVYFSLRPENFPHPLRNHEKAPYNRAMRFYIERRWGPGATRDHEAAVNLDVPELIRAQMRELGVPDENIGLDHAYLSPGEGAWLDGTPGAGRNLVAVVRHN